MLVSFIILTLIVGALCFLVSVSPLQPFFKTVIYVVSVLVLLVWLLRHLDALGIKF